MNIPQAEARSLRCRFEKTGPIRFISHLDLTRAFHRAFSRAAIPLKFSGMIVYFSIIRVVYLE